MDPIEDMVYWIDAIECLVERIKVKMSLLHHVQNKKIDSNKTNQVKEHIKILGIFVDQGINGLKQEIEYI